MRRKFIILSVVFLLVFLVVSCPGTVFAEFGVVDEISFWIHAIEFTQTENPGFIMDTRGYIYIDPNTNADGTFYAPLKVPNGVVITKCVLYFYHGLTETVPIVFAQERSVANNPYGALDIVQSSPGPYGTVDVGDVTINNENMFRLVVQLPAGRVKGTLRFKGVRVSYQRQISPAPATATFPDVPTTHGFFRNIEALVASGITTGYGDGTYGPNDYVTRGQMAAFLSRALGLHHPDPW